MSSEKKQLVVYVAVGNKRLVVPVRDPSQKVFELGALIAARFRIERVAELRTGEGFLIDANDTISEVLRDQQIISCLDYEGWVKTNNEQIINNRGHGLFADLENADFIDEKVKWIRCGYAQNMGKFYVRMGGERGWMPQQLDLFEPLDLLSVAKGKTKYVVSQIGDEKTGWFAAAEFIPGATGAVEKVILRCKSKSDKRESIKSLKITVNPGSTTPVVMDGEAKLEQTSELPEEVVAYQVPAGVATGPTYPDVEEKADTKKPEPDEIKGEGSLPLLITCKMRPEIDRGYQRSAGQKWDLTINTECEFLNRGESSLVLSKWTAEYKTKEGKWESTKLNRGSRRGPWNYSWERESASKDSIPIFGKVPSKFALGVALEIDALQLNRARCLHMSLPNPLELKFTVADINGGSVSIVIPVKSDYPADLDLTTLAKQVRNNGGSDKSVVGYVQCDDTVGEGRIAAVIFRRVRDGHEDEYEIRQNITNSYQTYTATYWKKIGFQQAAKGVSEFKIADSCYDNEGLTKMETYALIDVPRHRCYGVRIELKTTTSTAIKSFLLKPATPVSA